MRGSGATFRCGHIRRWQAIAFVISAIELAIPAKGNMSRVPGVPNYDYLVTKLCPVASGIGEDVVVINPSPNKRALLPFPNTIKVSNAETECRGPCCCLRSQEHQAVYPFSLGFNPPKNRESQSPLGYLRPRSICLYGAA